MSTPTIDDIQFDSYHLRDLLEVLGNHVIENCHFERDGGRDTQMDITSSLAWIARDLANKIVADFETVSDNGSKLAATIDGSGRVA